MNSSEVAMMMLTWEQGRAALDELEAKIKAAVLSLKETQKAGKVHASYSKGRKTYDYKGSAVGASEEVIALHTTEVPAVPATTVTDWKAVCAELEIVVSYVQTDPSVTLKIVEDKDC